MPAEPGRLRVGAERVQLASAAEVPQVVRRRHQHRERDQRQVGHGGDAAGAEVDETAGEIGRGDLAGADPDGVDAADDVQRAEGDDEGGHLAEGDEQAVEQAEADAEQDGEGDGDYRVPAALEVGAGGEGADAEGGADGQVDVAGDDDQGLAGGDQHQDGRVEQQVLDALLGQERAAACLGDGDHHQEHGEDGEFAHLEDAVHQPGGVGLRHLGDGGFVGGGDRHAVPLSCAAPPVRRGRAGVVSVRGPVAARVPPLPAGCGRWSRLTRPSRWLRPSRFPRWRRCGGSRR